MRVSFELFEKKRNGELDNAKEYIYKDIKELQAKGCRVKVITRNIDHKHLTIDRDSLSYKGILPTLLDLFIKKCNKNTTIRYYSYGKTCLIELHILPPNILSNIKKEKIIRYLVFKYRKKSKNYEIKYNNNFIYRIYIFLLKKQLKHNVEKAFSESVVEILFRFCMPFYVGENAYKIRGKYYVGFSYFCLFFLILILLICLEFIVL